MTDDRIKQLSVKLANQIAAGEVIERPASVVKELIENSLDAGATQIDITIKKGGKHLVAITDNGCGIHPEDLPLALSKHATSKISALPDLFAIKSLGFRGEALASISAVSRLRLVSHHHQAIQAFQVWTEGLSQAAKVTPSTHPIGTTVQVEDLFFNVPARRKFLRTDKTEFSHILDLVTRMALSAYSVGFKFIQDDRLIWQLPIAQTTLDREKRLYKLCGKAFIDESLAVDFEANGLRLTGWLGLPVGARNQADRQYCYLNQRIVKDRMINHAIRQAYGERLFPGRYPCYVLYLTIDPTQVDVNVHPTKHEVRFHESRLVHDFILRVIEQALASTATDLSLMPELANDSRGASIPAPARRPVSSSSAYKYTADFGSDLATLYQACVKPIETEIKHIPSEERFVGVLSDRFLLFESTTTLWVYDARQLHTQIQYRELSTLLAREQTLDARVLLLPCVVALNQKQESVYQQNEMLFLQMGFEIDIAGPTQCIIRKVPTVLPATLVRECFFDMLSRLAVQTNTYPWAAFLSHSVATVPQDEKGAIALLEKAKTVLSETVLQKHRTQFQIDRFETNIQWQQMADIDG